MPCRSFQSSPVRSQFYSIQILYTRCKTSLTFNLIDAFDDLKSLGDLNQVFVYEVYIKKQYRSNRPFHLELKDYF